MLFKFNFQKKIYYTHLFFLTIILLLVSICVFVYIYNSKFSLFKESQIQISTFVNKQIDSRIKDLDRIASGLMFNREFMNIMQSGDMQIQNYIENNEKIMATFITLDSPTFSTYRIMVLNDYTYYTLTKTEEQKDYIEQKRRNLKQISWHSKLHSQKQVKLVLPIHQDDWSESEGQVFSVARNIIDSDENIIGVIEVQHNSEAIREMSKVDPKVGKIAIYSNEGQLQYATHPDSAPELSIINPKFNPASANEESGFFVKDNIEMAYHKSAYTGWVVITYQDRQWLPPSAQYLLIIVSLSLFALSIVSIIILKYLTDNLTRPLVELNDSIKRVSLDNLSLPVSDFDQENDLIKQLNGSFERMFTRLKQSFDEVVLSRTNQERARFLALQSQMTPHTIHNTISMIESLSYMNGNKDVAEICVHFSNTLRYISDFTEREYTIRDELKHLNHYVKLIEKRFEGNITFNINIDEATIDVSVPKLTLQPIVENAIEHGLFGVKFPYVIDVSVYSTSNEWFIEVADNGIGFSEEKYKEMMDKLKQQDFNLLDNSDIMNLKIGGMGLLNIYTRFRIMYGDQFAMSIENLQPNGSKITISVIK